MDRHSTISNVLFECLEAETCGLSKSLTMALLSFALDFYVKRPLAYQPNITNIVLTTNIKQKLHTTIAVNNGELL